MGGGGFHLWNKGIYDHIEYTCKYTYLKMNATMTDWQFIGNTVGTLCWEFKGIIKYFVILFCAKTILQKNKKKIYTCNDEVYVWKFEIIFLCDYGNYGHAWGIFFSISNFNYVENYNILFLFWRNHCNGLCFCMSLDLTLFCTVPYWQFSPKMSPSQAACVSS